LVKKILFKKKFLVKKFWLKKFWFKKKILVKKEPYRIWDLFTTSPYGPFFLPKKLKKYTKL
jgi:hypothetical protein